MKEEYNVSGIKSVSNLKGDEETKFITDKFIIERRGKTGDVWASEG